MSERRGPERRSFLRPPLWLNLLLLVIAGATFAYAKHQRTVIKEKTARLFHSENSPAELNRIRDELAQMNLTKDQLAKELEARLAYLESLEGEEFYITIDTQRKKLQLRIGEEVAREADVQVGEPKTIASSGKTWTFYPLKGGFNVVGKDSDYKSLVPEWVYALSNTPIPERRPAIQNWLGAYVIFLPNNYVIHSPPPEKSPLRGPKPGSFMVAEEDLAAIWPRITNETRVYIF